MAKAILCRFALAGLACLAAGAAWAAPIDMESRRVLLDASLDAEVPSAALAALKTQNSGALAFHATADDLANDVRYALYVGCDLERAAPTLAINGIPMRSDAFPGNGGWLFRIHPKALQVGENVVEVSSGDKDPLAIDSLAIFSLVDTFEEVHFNRAFGMPGADKVQPAAHADQAKIDVLHYKLDVTLDMNSRFLTGTVDITVAATQDNVTQVVMDLDDLMSVSAATLQPGGTALTESQSGDRVFVTLPSAIDTGDEVTVRLAFSGTPTATAHAFSTLGYARTTSPGVPLIYTFSEPYSAREWWPCKDLPDDKATAEILITCPTAYEAISNGDLLSVTDLGGGLHKYHWSEGHPVATYLISLACTDYQYASGTYTALDNVTTMEVGHYIWQSSDVDELLAVPATIDVMEYFAETFGEYPFLDEKYVTATWGASFGMEHQTVTSINNGDLLNGGGTPGKSRRNIHELAHQWFGDLVTPEHFDHLWLNEGWASYCEALYYEHDSGQSAYFAVTNGWISTGISNTTALVNTNADAFAGSVVYRRGGFVLHMLRHVVGDTAFFNGTRQYLIDYAYGNVLTQDFEDAIEAAYGQQLDWFFDQWVYGIGRPSYTWWWGASTGNSIQVSVDQTGTFFQMPIDLHLTLSGGGTEIVTVQNTTDPQVFTITPTTGTVTDVSFDPLNWILKNATETGPPAAPDATILSVKYTGTVGTPTRATVAWSGGGGSTTGYEIQGSHDQSCWETIANVSGAGTTSHQFDYAALSGCLNGSELLGRGLHVRVRATSDTELPSGWSDVYSFRPSVDDSAKSSDARVLIVDAYDRPDSSVNLQPHSWCASHGRSIAEFGAPFDTCDNSRLGVDFSMASYEAVVWVASEESTDEESFSSAEQALVTAYLQAGGKFFVSGAEIGWDLDRNSGPVAADRTFYNTYLLANWPGSNAYDDSNSYSLTGSTGGIFSGMSIQLDDGNDGTYLAGWPDYFDLSGGSTEALRYVDAGVKIAGLQHTGTFSGGSSPGQLVYFGFGFETIVGQTTRDDVMARVMQYFGLTAELPVTMDAFEVY